MRGVSDEAKTSGWGFTWIVFGGLVLVSLFYEFIGHALLTGQSGPWVYDDFRVLAESSVVVWTGPGVGHIYSGTGNLLVAFPGFIYLLGGLSEVTHLLGLGMPSNGMTFGSNASRIWLTGTTWYIILPAITLLSSSVLFAVQRLLLIVSSPRASRRIALLAVAAVLFWLCVMWGHPDDAVAVGFLLLAISDVLEGKWTRAGWMLGLGLVCQPLIGLAIPVLIAVVPLRRMLAVIWRAVLPVAVVLIPPFLGDPTNTFRQVVVQPAMTQYKTPWLALAPRVYANITFVRGNVAPVSGGFIRTMGVVAALLVGVFVFRRTRRGDTPSDLMLIWLCGLALSFRIMTEAVLLPYYLAPILIVLAVPAARSVKTSGIAVATGVIAAILISLELPPWPYWLLVMASLAGVLTVSCPKVPEGPQERLKGRFCISGHKTAEMSQEASQ